MAKKQVTRQELEKAMEHVVPTNWCDPLLTGPEKVLPDGYSFNCKDVERLLLAIRNRLNEKIDGLFIDEKKPTDE